MWLTELELFWILPVSHYHSPGSCRPAFCARSCGIRRLDRAAQVLQRAGSARGVSKKGFANGGAAAGIVDDTCVKTVLVN